MVKGALLPAAARALAPEHPAGRVRRGRPVRPAPLARAVAAASRSAWRRSTALRRPVPDSPAGTPADGRAPAAAATSAWWSSSGSPAWDSPSPALLDIYISRRYLRLLGLTFVSLLGIFYISSFIDLSDKLFKGTTTLDKLLQLLLVRDAAVRLLRGPDRRAGGGAGHHRPADAEQRADRHAGLRHQPLPRGRAAARVRGRRQRRALRAREQRARVLEPPRRGAAPRDPDREADAPSTSSTGGGSSGEGGAIYHYEFFEPRRQRAVATCRSTSSSRRTGGWFAVLFASSAPLPAGVRGRRDGARGRWTLADGWMRDLAAEGETRIVPSASRTEACASNRPSTSGPSSRWPTA